MFNGVVLITESYVFLTPNTHGWTWEVEPPDIEEATEAISNLKNNQAAGPDGLPAELFKYEGEELLRTMHDLIVRIWIEETIYAVPSPGTTI